MLAKVKKKRIKVSSSRKRPSGNRAISNSVSLLSQRNMGGIIGGEGYDFQTRYIVVRIPLWLSDDKFSCLLHEGTGDVELRYDEGEEKYDHYQVKNHTITLSAFRGIVRQFASLDHGTGKGYERFIVVAPDLDADLKSLDRALRRIRGTGSFHGGLPQVEKTSIGDLKIRIKKMNLSKFEGIIVDKLCFDINISFLHDDDSAENQFIGDLQKHHQSYSGYRRGLLAPAYSDLIRRINAAKGKKLARPQIETYIKESIASNATASAGMAQGLVPGQETTSVAVDSALLLQVELLSKQLSRHAEEKLDAMRNALREGNRLEALEQLEALKTDSLQWNSIPNNTKAKILAFEAIVHLNDPTNTKKAKALLQEALSLDPTNTQPRLRAWIAYTTRGPTSGLKELEGADDVDSLNLRVTFLLESGKVDQAEKILQKIANG